MKKCGRERKTKVKRGKGRCAENRETRTEDVRRLTSKWMIKDAEGST